MRLLVRLLPKGFLRFTLGRLIRMIVVLLLFQVILFALIQSLPQNYVELGLTVSAFEESLEAVGPENEPAADVFLDWMRDFYRGELGESADLNVGPVSDLIGARLPRTLLLLVPGTLAGFLLGLWLGKRIAWRGKGLVEFAATLGGTAFYTSFPPWLAFVGVHVFALSLNLLPPEKLIDPLEWFERDIPLNTVIVKMLQTVGVVGVSYLLLAALTRKPSRVNQRLRRFMGIGLAGAAIALWAVSDLRPLVVDILEHLILPVSVLTLLSFGETMLIMRTTMLESKKSDHVLAAQARGLKDSTVRDRYAARVAILPVLTRFVVHLPYVIIGSFVLERVFFWDGMGQALMAAAQDNDLAVIMGVLSIVGIGILITHFLFDLITVWLDPRLRGITGGEDLRL